MSAELSSESKISLSGLDESINSVTVATSSIISERTVPKIRIRLRPQQNNNDSQTSVGGYVTTMSFENENIENKTISNDSKSTYQENNPYPQNSLIISHSLPESSNLFSINQTNSITLRTRPRKKLDLSNNPSNISNSPILVPTNKLKNKLVNSPTSIYRSSENAIESVKFNDGDDLKLDLSVNTCKSSRRTHIRSTKKSFSKSRNDILSNINLKDIVNYDNFLQLPKDIQWQLVNYLPNCDKPELNSSANSLDVQPVNSSQYNDTTKELSSPQLNFSVFNNEFISKALTTFTKNLNHQSDTAHLFFNSQRSNLRSRKPNNKILISLNDQKEDVIIPQSETTIKNEDSLSDKKVIENNSTVNDEEKCDNVSNSTTDTIEMTSGLDKDLFPVTNTTTNMINSVKASSPLSVNTSIEMPLSTNVTTNTYSSIQDTTTSSDYAFTNNNSPQPVINKIENIKTENMLTVKTDFETYDTSSMQETIDSKFETKIELIETEIIDSKKRRGRKRKSHEEFNEKTLNTKTANSLSSGFNLVPVKRSSRSTAGKRPSRLDSESPPNSPNENKARNNKLKKTSFSTNSCGNNTNSCNISGSNKSKKSNDYPNKLNILDNKLSDGSNKRVRKLLQINEFNYQQKQHKHQQNNQYNQRICSSPESLLSQAESDSFSSSNLSKASPNTIGSGVASSSSSLPTTNIDKKSINSSSYNLNKTTVINNMSFNTLSPSWSCTSESTTPSAKSDNSLASHQILSQSESHNEISLSQNSNFNKLNANINSSSTNTIDGMPPPRQTLTLAAMREKMRAKKLAKEDNVNVKSNRNNIDKHSVNFNKNNSNNTNYSSINKKNSLENSSEFNLSSSYSGSRKDNLHGYMMSDKNNGFAHEKSLDRSSKTINNDNRNDNMNNNNDENNNDDQDDEDDEGMQFMERMINSTDDLDELFKNAPDSIFELLMGSNGKSCDFDLHQYDDNDDQIDENLNNSISNNLSNPNEIDKSAIDTQLNVNKNSTKYQNTKQSQSASIKSEQNSLECLFNCEPALSTSSNTSSSSSTTLIVNSSSYTTNNYTTTTSTATTNKSKQFNSIDSTIERVTAASLQSLYKQQESHSHKIPLHKSHINKSSTVNSIALPVTASTATTLNSFNTTTNTQVVSTTTTSTTPNAYLVDSNGLSTALSIIQSLNPGAKVTTQHFYLVNSGPQLVLQPSSPLNVTADNQISTSCISTSNTSSINSNSNLANHLTTASSCLNNTNSSHAQIINNNPGLLLSKPTALIKNNSTIANSNIQLTSNSTASLNTMNKSATPLLKIPISDNRTMLQTISSNPQPIGIVHHPQLLSSQIRFIQPQHNSSSLTNVANNLSFSQIIQPSATLNSSSIAATTTSLTNHQQQQPKLLFICPNTNNFHPDHINNKHHTAIQLQSPANNTTNTTALPQHKYLLLTKHPVATNDATKHQVQLLSPQHLWAGSAPTSSATSNTNNTSNLIFMPTNTSDCSTNVVLQPQANNTTYCLTTAPSPNQQIPINKIRISSNYPTQSFATIAAPLSATVSSTSVATLNNTSVSAPLIINSKPSIIQSISNTNEPQKSPMQQNSQDAFYEDGSSVSEDKNTNNVNLISDSTALDHTSTSSGNNDINISKNGTIESDINSGRISNRSLSNESSNS